MDLEEHTRRAARRQLKKQERALKNFLTLTTGTRTLSTGADTTSTNPSAYQSLSIECRAHPRSPSGPAGSGLSPTAEAMHTVPLGSDNEEMASVGAVASSPLRTPEDRINQYRAVTIMPEPEEVNPDLVSLHIPPTVFVLTYRNLLKGGPGNAFLKAWQNYDGPRLSTGELLSIHLDGRNPDLFEPIYGYLQGEDVIPLNETRASKLCGQYPALSEVYDLLYDEARQYGLHGMMEHITAILKQSRVQGPLPAARFRIYDAHHGTPWREKELERAAKTIRVRKVKIHNALRVVVIGAATNFAVQMKDSNTPILHYSLQAPMSDVSEAFCDLIDCRSEEEPDCFVVEGTLTREQCRKIPLKIIYKDTLENPNLPVNSPHYKTSTRHTLDSVLLHLHPSNMGTTPEHFDTTFHKMWDYVGSEAEGNETDEEPSDDSAQDFVQRIWLSLQYATVTMRFEPPEMVPGEPEVTLELVHTATAEILELESNANPAH